MTVRVGIVDDHQSVVLGIEVALGREPACEVVASADTVGGLLALGKEIDVAILDLRLGDSSHPGENVRALRAAGMRVLVFTAGDDPHAIRLAAGAGAVGVLQKAAPVETIADAVLAATQDETVPSATWAAAIDGDPDLDSAGLSPREAEVLSLYAAGEKTVRVAHALGISEHTVIEHLRSIRVKYARDGRDAPTKVDLYRRAVEDGFLPAPRRRLR
ncbi:LuxR family two component transcriptional regulator [Georgenia soli]|uniref:LuxR family two component transcriptional regulator n=1 Tax=Georgenia soli TaxID=638953 RepID=A0A2A9EPB3_9MICO|nr:response regulator transcription factor [Georgenia soli]PFG40059.1 LuxR family two component transcriptional regulator [Georgenia soli]